MGGWHFGFACHWGSAENKSKNALEFRLIARPSHPNNGKYS